MRKLFPAQYELRMELGLDYLARTRKHDSYLEQVEFQFPIDTKNNELSILDRNLRTLGLEIQE